MITNRCSRLLLLVGRATLPPSFLLKWSSKRLLAFELRALADTVSFFVALEAKPLLLMSVALLRG
jgi:hypothetical protein